MYAHSVERRFMNSKSKLERACKNPNKTEAEKTTTAHTGGEREREIETGRHELNEHSTKSKPNPQ